MKLKYIKIKGYKNLDFEMTFPDDGIAVLIGNNGSGKSNVLEAISLVFRFYYRVLLSKKYKEKINLNFNYEIIYDIGDEEIILNNDIQKIDENLLPKKIYAIYSGEDLKLWELSYFPFYDSYIRKIKNMKIDKLPFIYINKYFWDIAILMLLLFDNDLSDIKLKELEKIEFKFNDNLFKSNLKDNKIVSFVKKISKDKKQQTYTFQEFKDLYDYDIRNINLQEKEQKQEFFELLMSAYLPDKELKTFKFIDEIRLFFKEKLDIFDLSEGEKKIILLKLLFNILMDENSIILLDEPDDNIHPANKKKIKDIIDLVEIKEKNIIVVTHSPTLTHFFNEKNIFMIDNGKIINDKDKKEIIEFLTNNNWTYQDINIVLSSKNDIFLVEGKTDELYLKTALNIFKDEGLFLNLEFDYIPVGGASGMKLFLEKFKTNNDRKVFALLDSDYAGNDSLKDFLTEQKISELKNEGKLITNKFILIYLPKPDFIKNNQYEIEDLFPNNIKEELAYKGWKNKKSNWQGTIKTIPKIDKDEVKKTIEFEVKNFNEGKSNIIKKESFYAFKKIFEIIEQIKNETT